MERDDILGGIFLGFALLIGIGIGIMIATWGIVSVLELIGVFFIALAFVAAFLLACRRMIHRAWLKEMDE